MKLPTDNVVMPPEEKNHFRMLFPEEKPPKDNTPLPQPDTTQTSVHVQKQLEQNTQKLKKEVMSLTLFIAVFFILNLPFVKDKIMEYIPFCHKSWIATHLVQSVLFALTLWIVVNSEYSSCA